jgi:hypothetical protein
VIPWIEERKRLPRLGKVRLGEKRKSEKSGKEYPAALDYFNFVDVPELTEAFGEKCRIIYPIVFHSDNREDFFPQDLKAYRQSGLFCKSDDGEKAVRVRVEDGKDQQGEQWLKEHNLVVKAGDMFEMDCPARNCDYYERKMCKGIGRLLFMIPGIPRLGVYEISTSSANGMVGINSYLDIIAGATDGRIQGVPFALKIGPHQATVEGKKKTVFIISIEYRGNFMDLERYKRIPKGALPAYEGPSRKELDKEVPDDLFTGEAIEEKPPEVGKEEASVEAIREKFRRGSIPGGASGAAAAPVDQGPAPDPPQPAPPKPKAPDRKPKKKRPPKKAKDLMNTQLPI